MSTEFDVNKLVLGEVAKVEDLSGQSVTMLAQESAPKGLLLAALAFVWQKRSAPEFSWNDALGLTLSAANEILGFVPDAEEPAVVIDGQPVTDGSEAGEDVPFPELPDSES